VIIYTDRGTIPLPEGWTVEEAIKVLEEVGHTILRISEEPVRAAS
jgi:hypothetical protein